MTSAFEETIHRLRGWQKGSSAAERLVGQLLFHEEYTHIEPIHPLGGPDQAHDLSCRYQDELWIAAVYFSSDTQTVSFTEIEKKFSLDFRGVDLHSAKGFAFFTNCHLTKGERNTLKIIASDANTKSEIYHQERIAQIVNRPVCYALRLEYFDIPMDHIEQTSFFSSVQEAANKQMQRFDEALSLLSNRVDNNRAENTIDGLKKIIGSFFSSSAHTAAMAAMGGAVSPSLYDILHLIESVERLGNSATTVGEQIAKVQELVNILMDREPYWSRLNYTVKGLPQPATLDDAIEALTTYESLLNKVLRKQEKLLVNHRKIDDLNI